MSKEVFVSASAMEFAKELRPYYVRKQPIDISLRLPAEAAEVRCSVLDHFGNDITDQSGLLYSRKNVLFAQNVNGTCSLCIYFLRARNNVTLHVVAKSSHGKVVHRLNHSCRIFSQVPKEGGNAVSEPSSAGYSIVPRKRPVEEVSLDEYPWGDEDLFPILQPPTTPFIRDTPSVDTRMLGVPVLPDPLVEQLHLDIVDDAVQELTKMAGKKVVGVCGMVGAGKTTILARIARHASVAEEFPDGIFWLHANFDTVDCYDRMVDLGGKLGINVQNDRRDCRRAIERLLLHTGENALFVLDDTWSIEQIRLVNDEISRSDGTRLLVGTSNSRVLRGIGGTCLRVQLLSKRGARELVYKVASGVAEVEVQRVDALCALLGYHLLALVLAARQKTALLGFAEVISLFEEGSAAFAPGGEMELFARGMEKTISVLDEDSKWALLMLSVVPSNRSIITSISHSDGDASGSEHGHQGITYEHPYYVLSVEAIQRLWNRWDSRSLIIVQSLLDAGILSSDENSADSKRIMMHTLTGRYLETAAKAHREKKHSSKAAASLAIVDSHFHKKSYAGTAEKCQARTHPKALSWRSIYSVAKEDALAKAYEIYGKCAKAPLPLKEYEQLKDQMPVSVTQPLAENQTIVGLGAALDALKEEVRLKHNEACLHDPQNAEKWCFDMNLLAHFQKTLDDLFRAVLQITASEDVDDGVRGYDVHLAMAFLSNFVQFGWHSTKYEMCSKEALDTLNRVFPVVESRMTDSKGRGVRLYKMGEDVKFDSSADACKALWYSFHCSLFNEKLLPGVVEFVDYEVMTATNPGHTFFTENFTTQENMVLDKIFNTITFRSNSKVMLYFLDSPEAVFFDALASFFDNLFFDVNLEVVRSKTEWEALNRDFFSPGNFNFTARGDGLPSIKDLQKETAEDSRRRGDEKDRL